MKHLKYVSAALLCGALALNVTAASAKTCAVAIDGNDQMRFNKDKLEIAADCTEVEVTLKHVGKLPVASMGHNWVLTETPVFQQAATDGLKAGPQGSYVQANDKRVIAHTKLIGGGETTTVKFPTSKLKKGGDYTFFCSFPGHWSLMKGKLTFG